MAQKELVFKLKFLDENGNIVEKTAQNIKEINKSITDLQDELDNTDLGSEHWQDLTEELGKAENALEQTKEVINETKNAQKSLGDQLTSAPGVVGQVSNSVKGLSKTFKVLLANPIVALIAAITAGLMALYKAFTSTKEGGEAVERIMAGLGATLDVLRDRVLKVAGGIVKFFKGDFAGAAEDVKGAFSGIGNEIAEEFNEAARVKGLLQDVADAQRNLNNERARQNTEIAKAKLVINDENKSYAEREAALELVRQKEIALAKQEEELAKQRYEAIKAQNALSDSSTEALDEQAAAYQALEQAQLASLQKQKELFDQQKALRDRRRAEQKAAAEERKRLAEEAAQFEQDLTLSLITDEEEKATRELEIQRTSQLNQIDNLRVSEEKKKELRLMVEKQYQQGLDVIADERKAKDDAAAEEQRQKDEAKAQEEYNKQLQANENLLELERIKLEQQEEIDIEDLDRTIELMRQKTDLLLQNEDLTKEQRLLIEAEYQKAVQDLEQNTFDKKKQLTEQDEQLQLQRAATAANALGSLAEALGETTAAGKVAAIAQATINTYLSATEAYKAVVGIPGIGPALAVAAAASAVAAGLGQVREIMSVSDEVPDVKANIPRAASGMLVGQGDGKMDNVPVMVSNGESIINAKSTNMFRPLLSAINQYGGGTSFNNGGIISSQTRTSPETNLLNQLSNMSSNTPIKTYVVSTDVSSSQSLDRQIKSRSVI